MILAYSDSSNTTLISASGDTHLIIPGSVVHIGSHFLDSSVLSVKFETESCLLSLGESCFALSKITKVDLSNCLHLHSLSYWCFNQCTDLHCCIFPSRGNLSVFSAGSFSKCNSLEQIVIPTTVEIIEDARVIDGVIVAYSGVFDSCSSLSSVIFEERSSCSIIGRYSFVRCFSLVLISFPESVSEIRERALDSNTGLVAVYLQSTSLILYPNTEINLASQIFIYSARIIHTLIESGIDSSKITLLLRDSRLASCHKYHNYVIFLACIHVYSQIIV